MKRRAEDEEDADADAFARAMADVARLPPDARERVRVAPRADGSAAPVTPVTPASPVAAKPDAQPGPEQAEHADFAAPGVDRRELKKLKRGDHAVAARLDLHGLPAAEATARVTHFLDNSRHRRHRCVCIVHGRGLHSEAHVAILRSRVRQLLRQHRAVLAFADAPPRDGGAGAVYVLLRRS